MVGFGQTQQQTPNAGIAGPLGVCVLWRRLGLAARRPCLYLLNWRRTQSLRFAASQGPTQTTPRKADFDHEKKSDYFNDNYGIPPPCIALSSLLALPGQRQTCWRTARGASKLRNMYFKPRFFAHTGAPQSAKADEMARGVRAYFGQWAIPWPLGVGPGRMGLSASTGTTAPDRSGTGLPQRAAKATIGAKGRISSAGPDRKTDVS